MSSTPPSRHPLAIALLVAATCLLAAWGCAPADTTPAAAASPSPPPRPRWTVMIYLDANTDLEKAQMENLSQLVDVGSSPEVNIVVLCARSPEGDEEEGYTNEGVANLADWSTCKLLHVQKGRLREVADWGHVDMASGRTLERFLSAASKEFPAERRALILNDHGLGWAGCCGDETVGDGEGVLSVADIERALRAHATAHGPLDLLGFDACLMANLEVARAVAPHARTMVASEELVPETGWAYSTTLRRLVEAPDMDATRLARHVADDFKASFDEDADAADEGAGATMSVIDLSRVQALSQAMEQLAAHCSGELRAHGRKAWLKLAAARSRSEQYGRAEEEGEESSELFDVSSFAEEIARRLPQSPAAASARQVLERCRGAVIHAVHGEARPRARGLSVFLPKKGKVLEEKQPVRYRQALAGRGASWLGFLEALAAITARQKERPSLAPLVKSGGVLGKGGTVTLTSRCVPEEIEEAAFVLAEPEGRSRTLMGRVPVSAGSDGQLSRPWDGGWFALSDGTNDVICPLGSLEPLPDQPGTYLAQVPAELKRNEGKKWRDITLHVLVRFRGKKKAEGRFVYAFTETRYGPRHITLRKGDRLRPVYVTIDAHGQEGLAVCEDPEYTLRLAKTNALAVDYQVLPEGRYLVGFVIRDHADHVSDELTPVQVR